MSDHGPLYDERFGDSGSPHGGAHFDEGFGLSTLYAPDAHGKLHDRFTASVTAGELHGELYDAGWNDMPTQRDRLFDEGFDTPTANTGEHGTWFDAFKGGAAVRFMLDGADYEGTVIDCNRDYATVKTDGGANGGGRHDLDYGQILAYKPANAGQPAQDRHPTAHPGVTDTSVVGNTPSPSLSARGGGERHQIHVQEGVAANKTAVDVDKDVDSDETAIQRQDVEGGHAYCPGCKHVCRDAKDGKCPTCGGKVTIRKSIDDTLTVLKTLAEA